MTSITGSAFQGKSPRVVNITIPVVNIIILRNESNFVPYLYPRTLHDHFIIPTTKFRSIYLNCK